MRLLPSMEERLKRTPSTTEVVKTHCPLPKAREYYARQLTYVTDAKAAADMVDLARQLPLSHVGFDTEFEYSRPGVPMGRDKVWHDPRSIVPLLMSMALVEPRQATDGTIYRFVVDLRQSELHGCIGELLSLPVPFVAHFAQAELFCLWQLGLREPRILWDTWVHEKALHLGRHHVRYKLKPSSNEADEAQAKEETDEWEAFRNSLVATCQRYGIPYAMMAEKERLQESFLTHDLDTPFTEEQLRYAAEDAVAAARLYHPQVVAAASAGILHHLETVEMPWGRTNSRIIWFGFRVSESKRDEVLEAMDRHREACREMLAAYGIENVRSHPQLKRFFGQIGMLDYFRHNGGFSFAKKKLDVVPDKHPAIPLIRAARRANDLIAGRILDAELVGADGRMHSDHRQLGTHTGRQSSRWPNILGLGKVLRPLLVPDAGRGIGEADLSQIEVGIAGAVYRDENLIEMFNSGDVYSATALLFFQAELSEEDRRLESRAFKRKHSNLRDRMKACTLGIIYGLTPRGLAGYLDVSESEAKTLQQRFMDLFPTLRRNLKAASDFGGMSGFASTYTGLRRHRARRGRTTVWEKNWLSNHPVQGSAAVVFKAAGNRLDALYQQYDAWIIVPLHDSIVFEAPLEVLKDVAELTGRVLCETVQEYFPELRPRAEINIDHPEAWNKDGHADSLNRWLADPMYTL